MLTLFVGVGIEDRLYAEWHVPFLYKEIEEKQHCKVNREIVAVEGESMGAFFGSYLGTSIQQA